MFPALAQTLLQSLHSSVRGETLGDIVHDLMSFGAGYAYGDPYQKS